MIGAHVVAAERTAEAVANVVGDGCVVRLYDAASGGLEAAAVAHRDRVQRARLRGLLDGPALSADVGWVADAYQKDVAFRLRNDAAADAAGGPQAVAEVQAAVAAPFRLDGWRAGVVVALRDSTDFAYSFAEQRLVEELAAGADLLIRAPSPVRELGGPSTAVRILEGAPGAVWVTDPAGRTTYVNHAACELVRSPSSGLAGAHISDFLEGESSGLTDEAVDVLLWRRDGTAVWVSVLAAPLMDDAGRTLGTVRTLTDVGERRGVEVSARMSAAAYTAVAELTEMALGGAEFAVLADEAVALTADLIGAEYVSLAEVSPLREVCVPRAVHGWPREAIGARFELTELSAARLCLDDDGPVVIRDYAAHDKLDIGEHAARAQARSAFFVRIARGAGVLTAHSPRVAAFSHEDLSSLRLLTSVLGARWEPRLAPLVAVVG